MCHHMKTKNPTSEAHANVSVILAKAPVSLIVLTLGSAEGHKVSLPVLDALHSFGLDVFESLRVIHKSRSCSQGSFSVRISKSGFW